MPQPSKSSRRAAANPAAKPSPPRPRNQRRAAAADPAAGPSSAHRPDQRRGREGKAPAMPPPRRTSPMPACCDLSHLTAEQIAKIDSDYLYFLRHVRFNDDGGYTIQDPSEDGGADPSEAVRHEQPLAGASNGGAPGGDPAPVGEAPGAEPKPGSPRDAPVCVEGDSSPKDEVPSGGASPDDVVKQGAPVARKGGARSGKVPMEMDSPAPAAEPAWYDSVDMDEDYRYFFKHTKVLDDGQFVFEKDDFSVNYGLERSGDNSKAEADATDDEVAEADATDDEEEGEEGTVEEEEDEDTDEEEEEDTDEEFEEEDDSDEEEEEDEEVEEEDDEEKEAVPESGEDGVGMGEKENDVEVKMEVGVGSDGPTVNALAFEGPAEKVKEEVETISVTWEDTARKESVDEGEKENVGNNAGGGSDLLMVPVYELEEPIQMVKEEILEDEQPLNTQVAGAPKLKRKAESLNWEANSSKGHDAVPHSTLELQGSVWPAHINERPESEFKEKLMKVLLKPFNQEECDKLFALATKRTPIIKERRTRNSVSYYPWVHELGKSYFDSYPDLADQVESSSYPNRLALLRGLFFWLEHIGLDGQFRPWSDDHKKYRVVRYY